MAPQRRNTSQRNAQIRAEANRQRAQNSKSGKGKGNGKRRPRDLPTAPTEQFSSGKPPRGGNGPTGRGRGNKMHLFDATKPQVLGLIRPVGPYTMIRTTNSFSSSSGMSILCPFLYFDGTIPQKWFGVAGLQNVPGLLGNAVNAAASTQALYIPGLDSLISSSTEIVPAAYTVRLMNGNALQTTNGIVYIGRSNSNLAYGNSTTTWGALGTALASTMNTISVSAARLALNPHRANCLPLDYNEMCDFQEIVTGSGYAAPFAWTGEALRPGAMSPLFVYNPAGITLEFQVTIQWRLRLDPLNPLASDHKQYRTSPITEIEEAVVGTIASGAAWVAEEAVRTNVTRAALFGALGGV